MSTKQKNLSELSLYKNAQSFSTAASEKDIFKHHIDSYDDSKTVKVFNLLYSLIVGLVSNVAVKNLTKYSKLIGVLLGVISFIFCRKFLKI